MDLWSCLIARCDLTNVDSGDADLYERIKIKYRINYRQTTTRFIELLIRSMLHSGKSQCDAPEKITGLIKSAYKSANVYIKNALMYASLRMVLITFKFESSNKEIEVRQIRLHLTKWHLKRPPRKREMAAIRTVTFHIIRLNHYAISLPLPSISIYF